MEKMETSLRMFRIHSMTAVVCLAAEFILGMYAALFVKFPENLAGGNAWAWSMSKSFVVVAHALLGSALAIVSIATFAQGIAMKKARVLVPSAIGLVSVCLAWLGGAAFLSNVDNDGYSFLMAVGFIAALISYGFAYHLARPPGGTVSA